MIHIGDIRPKPSDKWADMPEIPREDPNVRDKRDRMMLGCLFRLICLLVLAFAVCLGFLICSYLY